MQFNNYNPTDTFAEKCYASSSGDTNFVHDSLDELKFDRPFTYRGETFAANTNILASWKIRNQVAIFQNRQVFETGTTADKVLEFTPDFARNAVFEEGIYAATFSCRTSDSQKFEKTIEVRFEN